MCIDQIETLCDVEMKERTHTQCDADDTRTYVRLYACYETALARKGNRFAKN